MAGRESRARLLAPSFLVVATAIACGQTQGDGEDIATNPPGLVGGSGGTAGTGPITTGGGANPPALPQGCPASEPATGSACFTGYPPAPLSCDFEGPTGGCLGLPQYMVTASCVAGTWEKKQWGYSSCNPPYPLSCPPDLPIAGAPCTMGFGVYPPACDYPAADCPKRSASCVQGIWQVESVGCVPPSEGGAGGGGNEAGAGFEPVAGASNGSAGDGNESSGGAPL